MIDITGAAAFLLFVTLLCLGFKGAPRTMDPYKEIINGLLRRRSG